MDPKDDPKIVDGEIVAESSASPSNQKAVSEMLNLEQLIKTTLTSIEKLKDELKLQREMFEDSFKNDETYIEHDKLAKEAARIRAATKKQLLKQPSVMILAEKVNDLRQGIKENQAFLSDYLQQWQKLSNASEIETEDGRTLRIVVISKLVPAPTD
ncbi:MAG: hypothetical protein UW86_C0001G0032 [Microgenomates group bacterium GW2011_GWA1_Microgenomates_45_10]|nr:MAG: hypothetical protein UW69_C0003G0012 [Microgenomates group bacterium GW2011_GWA2_44_7]KKT87479.1 MAG: hypothetical protein UW86_C0001G0032 [Microgenomates group bacterium GW2011_GWA1_Microgenomates_45_10]